MVEINPVTDAFEALMDTLNIPKSTEDNTVMLGALLSMPDEDFEKIAPIILDQFQRELNDNNTRLALVASLANSGYKSDEISEVFGEVVDKLDSTLLEISQPKRDWIKQVMMIIVNVFNETEGISKRYINIPYEICNENAKEPAYAHVTDSGMDVYALEDITFAPGEQKIVPIGIKVALPAGYELQVRPKSGLSSKTKLRIANAPGTIDAGYRDEIGIIIENIDPLIKDINFDFNDDGSVNINSMSVLYGNTYTISKGQKFAQLVLSEVPKAILFKVEKVSDIGEDRGGGFGSTGQY